MKEMLNCLRGVTAVCLVGCLLPVGAHGNCLLLHDGSNHGHWEWHVTPEVHLVDLDSADSYFSGVGGTEVWRAGHDIDGELYGLTIGASPPWLANKIAFFASYRGGDLDGSFSTREIMPAPEGPYPGTVSFDTEEWEFGADIYILNAVYARLAYFNAEMDGTWVYSPVEMEPQEYDLEAFEVGVGFRQDFRSCVSDALTFGVDAYLALLFFDHEHKEVIESAVASTDGVAFKGRLELNAKYSLTEHSRLYGGIGYEYQDYDEGHSFDSNDLDWTRDAILFKFGIVSEF